jgi:integrase
MGSEEIQAYLSHLATDRRVSASTQNQALSSLLFLYQKVLDKDLPWLDDIVRAKRPVRLPVVLSRSEVARKLEALQGRHWLIASLLYGSGLRLIECLRLRVQDIDTEYMQIVVHDGKGGKDRRKVHTRSLAMVVAVRISVEQFHPHQLSRRAPPPPRASQQCATRCQGSGARRRCGAQSD